jgi:CPA1 family monovalent cation:H+ antiporter
MGLIQVLAILIVLTASFAWLNHRYLGLPTTIGVMLVALIASLALLGVHPWIPTLEHEAARLLAAIDFDQTVLHGLLGFLLFAGALHVDLGSLREHAVIVATLSSVGVLLSTMLVGALAWLVLQALGLGLPLLPCLVFGALISPTDPIAVLAMLKSQGAPPDVETQIVGESLFNDGVGVVVFLALLSTVETGSGSDAMGGATVAALFARETLGGIAFGVGCGMIAYWMLRAIDNYQVEIMVSLGLVAGGYALADALHLSAPIAMVVAGLLIGNHGRAFAMSARTREHLDTFWELIDDLLNAVLFVLIGLEVLTLQFRAEYLLAGLAAVPVVLLARFVSAGIPVRALGWWVTLAPHTVKILTWTGLRGGISVALALSLRSYLPDGTTDVLLVMTYTVVVFSIVVQGLTMRRVLGRYLVASAARS